MEAEKARENDVLLTVEKPGQRSGRIRADDPAEDAAEGPYTIETGDLPDTYRETRVVLLPVSPCEVHAYWDVGPDDPGRSRLGPTAESGPPRAVLRFHDVTGISPEGSGGFASLDAPVDLKAHSEYFRVCLPGRSYYAELGILSPAGQFAALSRSNVVQMPFAEPAPKRVAREDPVREKLDRTEAGGAIEAAGTMEAPAQRIEMVPAGRFVEGGEGGCSPTATAREALPGPFVEDRAEAAMTGGFAGDGWAPIEQAGREPTGLEPVDGVLEMRMAGSTRRDWPAAIEPLKSAARLPNVELVARMNVLEMIRRKYIELHRLSGRMWLFFERLGQPPAAGLGTGSPIPFEAAKTPDLTEISEQRFVLGLSSVSVVKE